jgi:haloalkane dehalogenase
MNAARRHDYTRIDQTVRTLAQRPLLTIFGQRNDPLRLQPKWKPRVPHAHQITIAKGDHFPMCDNPNLVATAIDN